jgi:hypothetical protein
LTTSPAGVFVLHSNQQLEPLKSKISLTFNLVALIILYKTAEEKQKKELLGA